VNIITEIRKVETGTPATQAEVSETEKELEFPLPKIMREIYLQVANGGIGPGYQILGAKGGHKSDEGDTISELYSVLSSTDPNDETWKWPKGLVPFCHWGCAIYSCFDITTENCPVVWFDPNMREDGEPMEKQFMPHRESLESWFEAWLNGVDLWEETYST
jgi:hypothetical protein